MHPSQNESMARAAPRETKNLTNNLARRLYRNSSLKRLYSLSELKRSSNGSEVSLMTDINCSALVPSISLKKYSHVEKSRNEMEFFKGRILLKKLDQPLLPKAKGQNKMKKRPIRKFEQIDYIDESILPSELKPDYELQEETRKSDQKSPKSTKDKIFKFAKSSRHESKLGNIWKPKQPVEVEQDLTPNDFMHLVEEDTRIKNEFCYLKKMNHMYDLKIVEFEGGDTKSQGLKGSPKNGAGYAEEYITISSRGITYFSKDSSRFVPLAEWKREAEYFGKLMKLDFFGKHKLMKNFSNWKKFSLKIFMKKTSDHLKNHLLLNDRHLRSAILGVRSLCCEMQTQITYCKFEETSEAARFTDFKTKQQEYVNQQFISKIEEVERRIKNVLVDNLSASMNEFKEENKISSSSNKGQPMLIGDEKNLEMPYTKEATLRIQQERFKRFLKLIEVAVVHSKINLMEQNTKNFVTRIKEENQSYQEYLQQAKISKERDMHFKGKQYLQCLFQLQMDERRIVLQPSRSEVNILFENIVNKSVLKLVRNNQRIINDKDISTIIYGSSSEQQKQPENNILKTVMASDNRQDMMVEQINKALNTSYDFIEAYSKNFGQLAVKYFINRQYFESNPRLESEDIYSIKQCLDNWKKELVEINKMNDQQESAIFLLNFKQLKEKTIDCTQKCLAKMRWVIPKLFELAAGKLRTDLQSSVQKMSASPIGVVPFITFQNNKHEIEERFTEYEERIMQLGYIFDVMRDMDSHGQTPRLKDNNEKKQLQQILRQLKSKVEEADMHTRAHEAYAQEQLKSLIPKINANIPNIYAKTKEHSDSIQSKLANIQSSERELLAIKEEIERVKGYQLVLQMGQYDDELINHFERYFVTYKNIWSFKSQVESYENKFLNMYLVDVDVVQTLRIVDAFLQTAGELKRRQSDHEGIKQHEYQIENEDEAIVSNTVNLIKKNIRPLVECIQCLKDSSLDEKQLRLIRAQFQRKGKSKLNDVVIDFSNKEAKESRQIKQIMIQMLLNQKIIEELDFLKKVVFKSKKQSELNLKISQVSRFWSNDAVNSSSKNLLQNFSEYYWPLLADIDEQITVINCVKEEPEAEESELKHKIESEKTLFDSLKMLLREWQIHNDYMTYLEPIFSNVYWKGSNEFKLFSYADSNWKKLTKLINKDFSLRKLALQEKKHIAILREDNGIFEELNKSVEQLLTSKRQAFPKFFFLPNELLLRILLADKEYASVQKYINRLYPNIKALDFNQEHTLPVGVVNLDSEYLAFKFGIGRCGEIDEGFKNVVEKIKQTLRASMLKCLLAYQREEFSRRSWIHENILQVLLFVSNAAFTKLIQYDYLEPEGDDLNQLLVYQCALIRQLQSFIKEDEVISSHDVGSKLSKVEQIDPIKLETLMFQEIHFRDVIENLLSNHIKEEKSFEWQKEPRCYHNGSELVVTRYLGRSVDYGFEFVCPKNNVLLNILSDAQALHLIYAINSNHLPILYGSNDLLAHFAIANAKNYFSLHVDPHLSMKFIRNLCFGAFYTGSFLEFKSAQELTANQLSTVCNCNKEFMFLEKKDSQMGAIKKEYSYLPSIIAFSLKDLQAEFKPIQQKIRINYRAIAVPQISISAYISFYFIRRFMPKSDLPQRIQKTIEIINQCEDYELISLEDIRGVLKSTKRFNESQITENIFHQLIVVLRRKIIFEEKFRYYERILRQTLLKQKVVEDSSKIKVNKDYKFYVNMLGQILNRTAVCALSGTLISGKNYIITDAHISSGIFKIERFNTDIISRQAFLGYYEKGIWKEGILAITLKNKSYSQEEWFVLEGQYNKPLCLLIKQVIRGQIIFANGQVLYLSPNWKFIISTELLADESLLPPNCPIITAEKFLSVNEKLVFLLERRLKPHFRAYSECYALAKNWCVNNFDKIFKMRIKIESEYILNDFLSMIEYFIGSINPKYFQNREEFSKGIEKMLVWCFYWTLRSNMSSDRNCTSNFESTFFDLIKTDISVSMELNYFQFTNPEGQFKKINSPKIIQLQQSVYFTDTSLNSKIKIAQMMINRGKSLLLIGDKNAGKSRFLQYLKNCFGEDRYSFLSIKMSRGMQLKEFEQIMYKKLKVTIQPSRQKQLESVNGKRLICMVDDFNLLEQSSELALFLRSCICDGYYYFSHTNEMILLKNVSFVLVQTSAHQLKLNPHLALQVKRIYFDSVNLDEILLNVQAEHLEPTEFNFFEILGMVFSIHRVAIENTDLANQPVDRYVPIDIPFRIFNVLSAYEGTENITKIWQYLSLKEYIQSRVAEKQNEKIISLINNRSNLILKNNSLFPCPIENKEEFLEQMTLAFPLFKVDPTNEDYYVYLAFLLNQDAQCNIFTIAEALPPSLKRQLLEKFCQLRGIHLIIPTTVESIDLEKCKMKTLVYCSAAEKNFKDIVQYMLSEKKNDAKKIDFKPSKPMYLIDFVDVQQWQKTIEQQPSLVHFGSVYFKNNPQSLTCCPQFTNQLNIMATLYQRKQSVCLTNHQKVQISFLVNGHYKLLMTKLSQHIKTTQQLIQRANESTEQQYRINEQIESKTNLYEHIAQTEQSLQKQLLRLKSKFNSDAADQSPDPVQTSSQEGKLAEISQKKKCLQDQIRTLKDKNSELNKINQLIEPIRNNYEQEQALLSQLQRQSKQCAVFLSFLEYFFEKNDAKGQDFIIKQAVLLPVPFSKLAEILFDKPLLITEKSIVLWHIAGKQMLLQQDRPNFVNQIQKYYPEAIVIADVNSLIDYYLREDGEKIQNSQPVIVMSQIIDANFFENNIVQQINERVSKEKLAKSGKEFPKQKQFKLGHDKYLKNKKDQNIDIAKRIFLISRSKLGQKHKELDRQTYTFGEEMSKNMAIEATKHERERYLSLPQSRNSMLIRANERDENLRLFYVKIRDMKERQLSNRGKQLQFETYLTIKAEPQKWKGKAKIMGIEHHKMQSKPALMTILCQNGSKYLHNVEQIHNQTLFQQDLLTIFEPQISIVLQKIQEQHKKLSLIKLKSQNEIINNFIKNTFVSMSELKKSSEMFKNIIANMKELQNRIQTMQTQRRQKNSRVLQLMPILWQYICQLEILLHKKLIKQDVFFVILSKTAQEIRDCQQEQELAFETVQNNLVMSIASEIICKLNFNEALYAYALLAFQIEAYRHNLPYECKEQLLKIIDQILYSSQSLVECKQTWPKTITDLLNCFKNTPENFLFKLIQFCEKFLKSNFKAFLRDSKAKKLFDNCRSIFIGEGEGNALIQIMKVGAQKNIQICVLRPNQEQNKIVEILNDKSSSQRVFCIDFLQSEDFFRLQQALQTESQQKQLKVTLVFTNLSAQEQCEYKDELSNWEKISDFPQDESLFDKISASLSHVPEHLADGQIKNIMKIVLFDDLSHTVHMSLKKYLSSQDNCETEASNLQIFQQIVSNCTFKNISDLINILQQQIYGKREKRRWFILEIKNHFKNESIQSCVKSILGQSCALQEESTSELSNFMAEYEQILANEITCFSVTKIVQSILPAEIKKYFPLNIYYFQRRLVAQQTQGLRTIKLNKQQLTKRLEQQMFNQLRIAETIHQKQEKQLHRNVIKEQIIKSVIIYKSLEQEMKRIRKILLSNKILSLETQTALQNLFNGRWFEQLNYLNEKITYLENWNSMSAQYIAKINLIYTDKGKQIAILYVLGGSYRSDLVQMSLKARHLTDKQLQILSEAKEKSRGIILENCETRHCKFDLIKNAIEVNDKNQNRQLPNLLLSLFETDQSNFLQSFSLKCKGQSMFECEFISKMKQESSIWKEKAFIEAVATKTPQKLEQVQQV